MNMQKKHPIDEKFKELQHQEVPPPEFVWQNVEKAIRPSGPNPWLLWLGGGMSIIVLITIVTVFFNADSLKNVNETAQNTQKSLPTAQNAPRIAVDETNKSPSKVADNGTADKLQSETAASKANQIDNNFTGRAKPTFANSADADNAPRYSFESSSKTTRQNSNSADVFFEKKGAETDIPFSEKTEAQQDFSPLKQKPNLDAKKTTKEIAALSPLDSKSIMFLDQSKPFASLKNRANAATFPITKPASKTTCFDFSEVGTVVAIEVYSGLNYGLRQLTLANKDQGIDWKNSRLDSEKNRFAWTSGLNAMFLTKTHWVLKGGLQFTQQNEVFEQKDPLSIRTVTVTTTTSSGTVTTTEEQVGYHHVRTYNRFNILDVPLSVGYEFRKGRKGFSVHAGANINTVFNRRGEIFDANEARSPLGKDDAFFKNNLGVSGTLSTQLFYTITPSLRVYAEPYIQHLFKPTTLANQPIQQRYTFGGVKIGVAKAMR